MAIVVYWYQATSPFKSDRYRFLPILSYRHLHSIMVASVWPGDHQGRPSTPVIHPFTAIDILCTTSRVVIIIIIPERYPAYPSHYV